MKKQSVALCICYFLFAVVSASAGDLDAYLEQKGLVNVAAMDTTIRVDLKYAAPENIMGEAVYEGITGVWLHPDAAEKLLKAQALLKKEYPSYSLLVFDAARPMSVQRKMWNVVRGTDKTNYVSNPAKGGGLHNYGMAVDVTILDGDGKELSMGTGFDFLGKEAHITSEESLVQQQKITRQELENRLLLRRIMRQSGFRTILYEWWHFNACTREEAKRAYPLID
ncbi:M15 family metallopeptidase [Massilibacteroides sp.]|uniref:M15 family metallopeptidase n=1 Tax=Massilibacteroides sp. TaxID=2034766 RepID=UPI0026167545|nr:M15 family metallopeptidase [Massilibacteroides sp.]MDD4514873.1 M15 family metallopeptidase [Massilibacteroides sp.]